MNKIEILKGKKSDDIVILDVESLSKLKAGINSPKDHLNCADCTIPIPKRPSGCRQLYPV